MAVRSAYKPIQERAHEQRRDPATHQANVDEGEVDVGYASSDDSYKDNEIGQEDAAEYGQAATSFHYLLCHQPYDRRAANETMFHRAVGHGVASLL